MYFPKGLFPSELSKGILSNGNFPNVQFPKRQFPKSVLATVLGPPHCSLRRLKGPNLTFGKLHIWEIVTWEVNPWENAYTQKNGTDILPI